MKKGLMKVIAAVMTIALLGIGGGTTALAAETECEHQFEWGVIENGILTKYVCWLCGETFTPNYLRSPEECDHESDGESDTETVNWKDATCTEEGYTGDTFCRYCGKVLEYGKSIAKTSHSWAYDEDDDIEPGCIKPGTRFFECTHCGAKKTEPIPARGYHNIGEYSEYRIIKDATCEKDGKKIVYCGACGEGVTKIIKATGHNWKTKKVTLKSSTKATIKYTCKNCKKTKTVTVKVPKKGKKVTVAGNVYKVTKTAEEVAFVKANKKEASLVIPATVKIQGVTYKVISVNAKAVSNNKVLKTVKIGSNVTTIAKNAFVKCPALTTIKIDSKKLTKKTASKASFKGINKKAVIKVDKKVKASYKKIFAGITVR